MKDVSRKFRQGPSKGGINSPPTSPRPSAPKGQNPNKSIIKYIESRLRNRKKLMENDGVNSLDLQIKEELEIILNFIKEL